MKQYKYIILALFAIISVGCEDQLTVQPAQSISGDFAVTNDRNVRNILIGVYDEAGQAASYGGRLQVIADLLGEGDNTVWAGTFIDPRQIKEKKILEDNGFVSGFWNNSYEVINQANIVIDNIAVVNTDLQAQTEGEARFLRALTYFDLARHFTSGELSVPLRTEGILDYSVSLDISRANKTDVYDLIINDLESAISLLPETNSFFADKYSAQALLARVYLHIGNMTEAKNAANNVIQMSGHSLSSNYAGAFNNDADTSEDVFSFQVTSQSGTNSLITYYADQPNGGRGGDIEIQDSYISSFDDANDERANFFYSSAQTGARLTSKYTNQFANIPLIRLAEMYLIRAEGNVANGTSDGDTPLNDLNALRARSGATLLTGPISKSTVLKERKLELAFEGFSIHDVIRNEGVVDGFLFNSNELVLPIPQSELDTNSAMTQNPGY